MTSSAVILPVGGIMCLQKSVLCFWNEHHPTELSSKGKVRHFSLLRERVSASFAVPDICGKIPYVELIFFYFSQLFTTSANHLSVTALYLCQLSCLAGAAIAANVHLPGYFWRNSQHPLHNMCRSLAVYWPNSLPVAWPTAAMYWITLEFPLTVLFFYWKVSPSLAGSALGFFCAEGRDHIRLGFRFSFRRCNCQVMLRWCSVFVAFLLYSPVC